MIPHNKHISRGKMLPTAAACTNTTFQSSLEADDCLNLLGGENLHNFRSHDDTFENAANGRQNLSDRKLQYSQRSPNRTF